jgi:transposase InsO family protein
MGMPQLIITSVLVERRSKSEVAREYGVSRPWVITLVQRYLAEGDLGLQPRSRRPHRQPTRTASAVEAEIVEIRKHLDKLAARHAHAPAVSTIWRILSARGFVTPQPHKRPKASYVRFAAEQPNERWQSDITHWSLADGTADGLDGEILHWLDDHSRLCLASIAHSVFKAPDVEASYRRAAAEYGNPAAVLTDIQAG